MLAARVNFKRAIFNLKEKGVIFVQGGTLHRVVVLAVYQPGHFLIGELRIGAQCSGWVQPRNSLIAVLPL